MTRFRGAPSRACRIRPGAKAADVDTGSARCLKAGDLDPVQAFHGTRRRFFGDSANAKPRLHPKSEETLEIGMVFNVEPAIYFEGYGGMRHCDMVAVTGQALKS